MPNSSERMALARLRVQERHGIRRFLYPLTIRLPFAHGQPSRLRVAETNGTLLPSETVARRRGTDVTFAVSLAPHEKRSLHLVETEDPAVIPDPLRREPTASGFMLRQERVAFGFAPGEGGLRSVVYDGVEHLAGPLALAVNGEDIPPEGWEYSPLADGLGFSATARGDAWKTRYDFTACKSWVQVTHTLADAPADTEVRFTLPLASPEEIPTCDFGVGSGAYAKIGGLGVAWTVDFAREPYACWEIAYLLNGAARIDYEGETRTRRAFTAQSWFHWMLRARSLAVAVTHLPDYCDQLRATLGRDGRIEILFRLGRRARRARFGVCYHFLNDIPAIAAATNPASILLPPEVTFKRLG